MTLDEQIRELERRGVKATVASAKAASLFAGAGAAEDAPREQTFVMPYPPSMNKYWLSTILGKPPNQWISVFISKEGNAFREKARGNFTKQKGVTYTGPLEVLITFCPPDKRERDFDNPIKPLLDALERDEETGFPGAYLNDNQIKHCDIWMRSPIKSGLTRITIRQLD